MLGHSQSTAPFWARMLRSRRCSVCLFVSNLLTVLLFINLFVAHQRSAETVLAEREAKFEETAQQLALKLKRELRNEDELIQHVQRLQAEVTALRAGKAPPGPQSLDPTKPATAPPVGAAAAPPPAAPAAPIRNLWDEQPADTVPGQQVVAPPPAQQQQQQQRPPAAAPPPPASAQTPGTAVLIICYNRPQYLTRTLDALLKWFPTSNKPAVFISQDGDVRKVSGVIETFQGQIAAAHPDVTFTHLRHSQVLKRGDDRSGYSKLARHFGWALNQVFKKFKHARCIVLEDDLEIAPDFFGYFEAVAPILDTDPTVLAATAWNDIGQAKFVEDPTRLYRSDFFGGLGWMLTANMWAELGPKWPTGYWDDWLREPVNRKGRTIIRPEVSRTYTFGKSGTSGAQFFNKYLANIKLNDAPVDWRSQDVSYLMKSAFDESFFAAVNAAPQVPVKTAVSKRCSTPGEAVRVVYQGFNGRAGYVPVATAFGFITDVKANVPRTAYGGVVTLHYNGCVVYITPPGTIEAPA